MDNSTQSGITVLPSDPDYLGLCALVIVAIQMACFVISAVKKFDKLNDLVGGSNFVLLAWLTFGLAQVYHARQIALNVIVTVWGVRLSLFLFYRILKTGEDWRFDEMRVDPCKLSIFWILQAIWVFGTGLPVYIVNSPRVNQGSPDLQALDYVGIVVAAFGFLCEVVADHQKNSFRNDKSNSGKPCTVGLWSWSRHPNYFGEVTVWWGIFILGASVFRGWHWVAVESPIVITVLLIFISGVPLLEKNADKRYKDNPHYLTYRQSTSPVIPMPPCLYAALPNVMQLLCCCECPGLYRNVELDIRKESDAEKKPFA